MKPIFVTAYLGGTHGTAKSARDFLRALLACKNNVMVISPGTEVFPATLCGRKLGHAEWLYAPRKLSFPQRQKLSVHALRVWWADKFKTILFERKTRKSPLIVNGWASYSFWKTMCSHMQGPRAIIVRESPRHFDSPDLDLKRCDLLQAFAEFDHYIFVSQNVCDEWRQYTEITGKPFSVLPNCCEEEEISSCLIVDRQAIREKLGFHTDDFLILCPGTIEHRKGQDLLLSVLPQLQAQIPHLRVLLVGDPVTSWGHDLLDNIPDDLLDRCVIHWHARPDILEILHAADLLVFPSRAEALPRTILEAMVIKTPVVASDVDGIPELIEDGVTGLLFARDSTEELLSAILHLHAKPELGRAMSEAGSVRYWQFFSRRHQFERVPDILRSIIDCRKSYSKTID